jgi:hypothetical protein
VRAAHLREVWDGQLREAFACKRLWTESSDELGFDAMKEKLHQLQTAKENRLVEQNEELIKMVRFVREGYNAKLQIHRIRDGLNAPRNQIIVAQWCTEADAEYELLKSAREQGDYHTTQEHHSILKDIQKRSETLRSEDEKAQTRAGRQGIGFIIISILAAVAGIVALSYAGIATESIPVLGIPYSVVAWSMLGAVAAMLYRFLNEAVGQLETVKWLVVRPIQGIIMGCFLYYIIATGLIVVGGQQVTSSGTALSAIGDAVRPELGPIIAFLGGFSDRFTNEMVNRATSIFSDKSAEE